MEREKINKSSMHYKLYRASRYVIERWRDTYYFERHEVNLCSYLWSYVGGLACMMHYLLSYSIIAVAVIWIPIEYTNGIAYLFVLGSAGIIFMVHFIITFSLQKRKDRLMADDNFEDGDAALSTWGVFKAFMKAKKEKLCPILEVVDDD